MSEWGAWFRVIKETGPGRKYLYLQRTRRVPSVKDPIAEGHSLGRISGAPVPRKRHWFDPTAYDERKGGGIALALLGWRDEYDRPRDSVYNRIFHKDELEKRWAEENPKPELERAPKFYDHAPAPKNNEAAPQSEAANESAGAGNGDAELSE
jgi:hypothetical protein